MYQAWIRKSVAAHAWALMLPELVYIDTDDVHILSGNIQAQIVGLYKADNTDKGYELVGLATLGELADNYARMQYWRGPNERVCLHKCDRCGGIFDCEKEEIKPDSDTGTVYCKTCLGLAFDESADRVLVCLARVVENVKLVVSRAADNGDVLTGLQYFQALEAQVERLALDSESEEN